MTAPDYLRQTGEPMDDFNLMLWLTESRHQATIDYLCTWIRITLKPSDAMAIYEGWVAKPDPEPEPAWAVAPLPPQGPPIPPMDTSSFAPPPPEEPTL